jgi:hypothetical protein
LDEAANREVLPWVADLLSIGDEPGEILQRFPAVALRAGTPCRRRCSCGAGATADRRDQGLPPRVGLALDDRGDAQLMHDRGEDAVLRGDVERVRLGDVGVVLPMPRTPSFDLRPAQPH